MLKRFPGPATPLDRQRAGFTLSELLVAAAAMSIVLVFSMGTFTANRNAYVVIDNVSEAHQNLIAIGGLVERDIRHAGYMVPRAAAACGVDDTNGPDMLFVSDSEAIAPADELGSGFAGGDLRARPTAAALPAGGWGGTIAIALDDLTLDGVDSYDTDATPGADSDFRPGAGAIFTNLDDPSAGVWCALVTDVDATTETITVDLVTLSAPPAAGDWAVVPAHVYRIDAGVLERSGTALASEIEDLQVAWFYDLDDDGQLDNGEDIGSGGVGEPDLVTTNIGGSSGDPALLRELRVNLVARTADNDPNDPTSAGIGQARENRVNPPPADGRRRRVHTATVRLRNLMS